LSPSPGRWEKNKNTDSFREVQDSFREVQDSFRERWQVEKKWKKLKENTQIQSRFVVTESLQVPKKWRGWWRERDGVRRGRERSFFFLRVGVY
jgi:hypothetical protein